MDSKELDEVLIDCKIHYNGPSKDDCFKHYWIMDTREADCHRGLINGAIFARNLMKAIEEGRLAVVPVEPTSDMTFASYKAWRLGDHGKYQAAIKAAPDVMGDLKNDK